MFLLANISCKITLVKDVLRSLINPLDLKECLKFLYQKELPKELILGNGIFYLSSINKKEVKIVIFFTRDNEAGRAVLTKNIINVFIKNKPNALKVDYL